MYHINNQASTLPAITQRIKSKNLRYSERYLSRYLNFIDQIAKGKFTHIPSKIFERHHILPQSLFPELSREPSNILKMSAREHFICHWMLAKIFGGSQWFSFNMMQRVIGEDVKSSYLYELAREYISIQISQTNTGRKPSAKNIEASKLANLNTVVVRSGTGEIFRTSVFDPRYLSGEYTHICVGRTHTAETKKKMSENGVGGRIAYTNGDEVIFLCTGDSIPKGFSKGGLNPHPENYLRDHQWYNNGIEEIRAVTKPAGYVMGRLGGPNLANHLNNSEKIKTLDMIGKCFVMSDRNNIPETHGVISGVSLDKVIVYRIGNEILVNNKTELSKFLNDKGIFLTPRMTTGRNLIQIRDTPLPSGKNVKTENVRNFLDSNAGKLLNEVGLYVYQLSEFEWVEGYKFWRKNE